MMLLALARYRAENIRGFPPATIEMGQERGEKLHTGHCCSFGVSHQKGF